MNKIKRPILLYCLFIFCALAIISCIINKIWIPILLWLPLSIVSFIYIRKKERLINISKKNLFSAKSIIKAKYIEALNNHSQNIEFNFDDFSPSLQIDQYEFKTIDTEVRKECLNDIIANLLRNGTLSPEDYSKINNASKKLNIDLSFDEEMKKYIEKLIELWKIDNEDLPVKKVDISLQDNEVCHYVTDVKWMENKTITTSIKYSGVTASFKIAKGVRYRVGNIKPQRVTVDKLVEIDKGILYVTNKRIIFMGDRKNNNIKYQSILSIVPYSDGVEIEKDSGKSPVLICLNSEVLSRILARLNN